MIKTSKEALDHFVYTWIDEGASTQMTLVIEAVKAGHVEKGSTGSDPHRDIESALKRLKTRKLIEYRKADRAWFGTGVAYGTLPTDANGAGGLPPVTSEMLGHLEVIPERETETAAPAESAPEPVIIPAGETLAEVTVSGAFVDGPGVVALLEATRPLFQGYASPGKTPDDLERVVEVAADTFDALVETVRALGHEQCWLWIAEFPWLVTQVDVWEMQ